MRIAQRADSTAECCAPIGTSATRLCGW